MIEILFIIFRFLLSYPISQQLVSTVIQFFVIKYIVGLLICDEPEKSPGTYQVVEEPDMRYVNELQLMWS